MSFEFEKDEKFMAEVKPVKEKLKEAIHPKNEQLRSLGVEVGGLEEGKKGAKRKADEIENETEIQIEDVWDNRSEEVADMTVEVFQTTGMRSLVDKQKRQKLQNSREDDTPSSEIKPTHSLNIKEARRDIDFSMDGNIGGNRHGGGRGGR